MYFNYNLKYNYYLKYNFLLIILYKIYIKSLENVYHNCENIFEASPGKRSIYIYQYGRNTLKVLLINNLTMGKGHTWRSSRVSD